MTLGYRPAIVHTDTLFTPEFRLKVLFAPELERLSEEDRAAVDAFRASGGTVYVRYRRGYHPFEEVPYAPSLAKSNHTIPRMVEDLMSDYPEKPFAKADTPLLQTLPLRGADYDLIVLTNLRVKAALPGPVTIRTASPYRTAVLHTTEGAFPLKVEDGCVTIDDPKTVEYGGVLVLL